MTQHTNSPSDHKSQGQASLLPTPDQAALLRVRIKPAEFARSLGVSKTAVSRWIRDGYVSLFADGRLDPVAATSSLLRKTDPGRMRNRWIRQAATEVQELRAALADAEDRAETAGAEIARLNAAIKQLETYAEDSDYLGEGLKRLFIERESQLRATAGAAQWCALVNALESELLDTCERGDDDDWLAEFEDNDSVAPVRLTVIREGDG